MLSDDELSRIPCYISDVVKKKECNFCCICFIGSSENIDIEVSHVSDFQLHISKYFSELEFSDISNDFYILVFSTSLITSLVEKYRDEKSL